MQEVAPNSEKMCESSVQTILVENSSSRNSLGFIRKTCRVLGKIHRLPVAVSLMLCFQCFLPQTTPLLKAEGAIVLIKTMHLEEGA